MPYVNVASNSDLTKGTKTIHIEGNSVALANSNLSTSMGDEPGTAGGGLVSSKTRGKLTWGSASIDVKFEGKGVVRFMDVTQHNGNSFNTAFMSAGVGGTGFAYGDDFEGPCIICQKDPDGHAVLERPEGSLDLANKILKDLKAREDAWSKANTQLKSAKAERDRLQKDSKVKPETVAARNAKIQALEQACVGLTKHRREGAGGYMFGVMVCRNGKKFAATSGNETPEGFETIAASHGCTVIKEAATLEDFKAANGCAEGTPEAKAIGKRWDDTMLSHQVPTDGYRNRPGTCAGAKLIGKSGHVAHSMTEIYFAFMGSDNTTKTFNVIYRGPTDYAPSNGPWTPPSAADLEEGKGGAHVEKRGDMRRKKETTMLSCQSCQDTLFMARCNIEKKSCG